MRVGCSTDWHVDVNHFYPKALRHLIERVSRYDLFIFAGDLTHDKYKYREYCHKLRKAAPDTEIVFVAGNHDIWLLKTPAPQRDLTEELQLYLAGEKGDLLKAVRPEMRERRGLAYLLLLERSHSGEKMKALSAACIEADIHLLDVWGPLVLGKVAIVGNCGWYDYSYRVPRYNVDMLHYRAKHLPEGGTWMDAHFAFWGAPDELVCEAMVQDIYAQLAFLARRHPEVKEVIAVTHHVPHPSGVKITGEISWDFFNAFMGCGRFSEVYQKDPRVYYAVFGHTHFAQRFQVEQITYSCAPFGYLFKEEENPRDLRQALDEGTGNLEKALDTKFFEFEI